MSNKRQRGGIKLAKWLLVIFLVIVGLGIISIYVLEPEYAYTPPGEKVLSTNDQFKGLAAKNKSIYDLWGQNLSQSEVNQLKQTDKGQFKLSAKNGAVAIDDELLNLGRTSFYEETFGNEVFLTDIVGLVNGALTIPNMTKAILRLKGQGTSNLQVELAEAVTIGEKTFKKGDLIETGIDVPKGAYTPLGMPVKFSEGRVKVGVSCAACHATVDWETKTVIEGAPNADLNLGLLLALATNSAAYFTHTDVKSIEDYLEELDDRKVITSTGKTSTLPDPVAIEKAVDQFLIKWPRGNFDSTIDLENNPAQIPDSFTLGDHPYGWSGFAAAGPFNGLSSFTNNVHAQNADSLSQSEASSALFGIDKEVYLGTILQNAANPDYRYDPKTGIKPSEFFRSVDPTPVAPGVNQLVKQPLFPKVSLVAPDGLIASSPGFNLNEQNNAMAAWQNTIVPPDPKIKVDKVALDLGRGTFKKAGCISCHAGAAGTNNRIISAKNIGTEPSRAKAFKKTQKIFGESVIYSPETPVPVPNDAEVLRVPVGHLDTGQIKLAYAHGDSPGGYKVKGLVGLYWTAPYLHDGGVAVGPDAAKDLGMAGTLMKGVQPDPENSLRALIDKKLRQKVIEANKANEDLRKVHVTGTGHQFWVDSSTGFSKEEQDAIIQYLLSIK
jgi:hypothetical protein